MPKTSTSKPEAPWQRYAFAAIAGVSVIAAVVFWQSAGKDDAPTDSSEHKASSAVFGPGMLSNTDDHGSLSHQDAPIAQQMQVPGRLLVDPTTQQLILDPGLLEVINYFLLEQTGGNQVAALQNYLKSKLPAPAYAQATGIVEHYRSYMKAHDGMLQGQNFGGEDIASRTHNIERLLTWREQRNRLRTDTLGADLVRAWYQNDDAELNEVLQELQQRNQSTATTEDGRSLRDTNGDPSREQDMQQILNRATQSYAALAKEKQIWAQHFATFQAAVVQINQQTNLPTTQRNRQIAELLQKSFPTEEERQHARDSMP
jgi:lipase chaperone LimK